MSWRPLEAACVECLSRERQRLGRFGAPYAWGRLIADTISAAILLRLDARRRMAWHHAPRSAPTEALMMRLWQDVKYGARLLQRAPLFSLVVIATLALTIGATTAAFTVVNAVLLHTLPYRDPTRLVLLHEMFPGTPIAARFSRSQEKSVARGLRGVLDLGDPRRATPRRLRGIHNVKIAAARGVAFACCSRETS